MVDNRTYQAKLPRRNVTNGLNDFFFKKMDGRTHSHNCFTLYNISIKTLKSQKIKHKQLFTGEK